MPKKGDTIAGRIELVEPIGGGGQGTVWAAIDRTEEIEGELGDRYNFVHPNIRTSGDGPFFTNNVLDSFFNMKGKITSPNCAVKFLNNLSEKAIARFKEEYEAVKLLRSPKIIEVRDYDIPQEREHDGPPWILMEYIPGGNLYDYIKRTNGGISISETLQLFRNIVEAVQIAHSNDPQIIHRDLKPENILMRDGITPVVSDFGICLVVDDKRISVTSTDENVGARHYIAPELEGSIKQDATPKTDLYSLGKILYFMLSGGTHLRREAYERSEYDLRKMEIASQMEYVYDRIFAFTICEDESRRFPSTQVLTTELDRIIELVEEHFYPLRDGRKCIICGKGRYVGNTNIGVSYANWRLTCDYCGNVQFFKENPVDRIAKNT